MTALSHRTVLITGAAGGLGAALCRRFAAVGANVVAVDLPGSPLDAVVAELGDRALAVRANVTDPASCRDAVAAALARFGRLDVLVNNAGITHFARFADTDPQVLRRVMDVNYFGAVHCTQAALPSIVDTRGQVVVISSVAGFAPIVGRPGYVGSKHAVTGLFSALRAELAPDGVGVTVVCPAFVATGIDRHALGATLDGPAGPRLATGRPSDPDRVAAAVVRGVVTRRRLVLPDRLSKLAWVASRLAPALYERLMARRLTPERAPSGRR